jgi:hypothetical protein
VAPRNQRKTARSDVISFRSLDVFAPEMVALFHSGLLFDTIFHPLPEPDKWREKFTEDPGMGSSVSIDGTDRTTETGTKAKPYICSVLTMTQTRCIATKNFCEPFEIVIVVHQVSAGSAGGSVTVGPVAAGATKPNFNWMVYKYHIGTGYHYQFRVKYKVTERTCDDISMNSTKMEILSSGWVLASRIKKEICPPPDLIAGPFAFESEAKKVADSQREPKVADVKNADKDVGLEDQ